MKRPCRKSRIKAWIDPHFCECHIRLGFGSCGVHINQEKAGRRGAGWVGECIRANAHCNYEGANGRYLHSRMCWCQSPKAAVRWLARRTT